MISISDEIKLRAEVTIQVLKSIPQGTRYDMGNTEWANLKANRIVDHAIKKSLNFKENEQ